MNSNFLQFILKFFVALILLATYSCDEITREFTTKNSAPIKELVKDSLPEPEPTKSIVDNSLSNSIANLKLIEVQSENTGQKYTIGIGLPTSYSSEKDKTYPVIYQLDAEIALHSSIETSRGLASSGDLEEVIIVGIFNYALNSELLDFTPSKATHPDTKSIKNITDSLFTGESDNFYHFIVDELMPRINSNYRTDKMTNVLFGHSLGGLFCLSALQKDKSPFTHYLISSPSVWWNNQEILKKKVPKRNFDPVVYLSVGGMEQIPANLSKRSFQKIPETVREIDKVTRMVTGIIDVYDYLQRQRNVDVYAHIEEGEVHMSSNVPSFSRGIRTLLLGANRDLLRERSFDSPLLPWE
jgi:predicted alpha/beta superfamily hydrolase